ncbi:MAG: peptidylprolyl isomerase [Phycisphaerales bacterium]
MSKRIREAGVALMAAGLCGGAYAQLSPDRTYYGINRAMPMTVSVPSGAEGVVEIGLFAPADPGSGVTEPRERASAEVGKVDLAGLFPVLWTTSQPTTLYAQLMVGGKKVGSPVVLQPMVSVEYASNGPQTPTGAAPVWAPRGSIAYSGIKAWSDKRVIMETTLGEIEIAMRPDMAPNSVWNFLELVEGGYYTDIIFHRVVPATQNGHPFVIQAGDPTGNGDGGPGHMIDLERSTLEHDFGVLSMARTNDPNTNGSQFFLCLSREGTSFLDGRYTAFGQTVRGAEAIVSISNVPLADPSRGRPAEPPVIKSARTVAAPPFGEGARPVSRPAGDASNPQR